MYERILVCTDGSELSAHAVTHALNLAKTSGAKLLALRVIPRYRQSYLEGGPIIDQKLDSRIEASWVEHAQSELAADSADRAHHGVEADHRGSML